jgi:RNA polymerase sigma factor (sigma-70 family)
MARRSRSSNKSNREVSDDGHLIELVRSGDLSAFDHLYERHVSMASTVAKRNVDNPSDAEDVVAEAFQSVLRSLVAGKGPDTFFRAYLLSTVTRLSHQQNRKSSKVLPSGDESVLDNTMTEPDAAVQAFESNTVARAFRSLPERWQAVLWYLDVERMKPAAVAPILGVSANAVSALAVRAREGLRSERSAGTCKVAQSAQPPSLNWRTSREPCVPSFCP